MAQETALEFVRKLLSAPIQYIALENPISVISSRIRKPDQIVQPYLFGDEAQKTTCLWLKNLPPLKPTKVVGKGKMLEFQTKPGTMKRQSAWILETLNEAKTPEERRTLRSKTFPGMANAFANQWSE